MDDGRLANEMTLEGIATQLKELSASMKQDLARLDSKMTDGFKRVDEQLNDAKIRDEEAHSLLKFSLEAREALRETTETRFDEMQKKQDEEIGLLKDVLRDLRAATNRS